MRVATPGTALVPLHGKGGSVRAWAIVDEADADAVHRYRWFLSGRRRANPRQLNAQYARRNATIDGRKRGVYLHRELLGLPPDLGAEIGDHINHDTLDNRRANLRVIPRSVNQQNRLGANVNSRSGIRGVFWEESRQRWTARVRFRYRAVHVGRFKRKEDAVAAVVAWRAEHMPYSLDALDRAETGLPAAVVRRMVGSNRLSSDALAQLVAEHSRQIELLHVALRAMSQALVDALRGIGA